MYFWLYSLPWWARSRGSDEPDELFDPGEQRSEERQEIEMDEGLVEGELHADLNAGT